VLQQILKQLIRECHQVLSTQNTITVLGCANAAGIHEINSAVIGGSQHLRCLKGVHNLPVHCNTKKVAWVTREIFSFWFHNHFVPAAWAYCRQTGLEEFCKIILFLSNSSAHPPPELLVKSNVFSICLPSTLLCDICNTALWSRNFALHEEQVLFLTCMLAAVNTGIGILHFLK